MKKGFSETLRYYSDYRLKDYSEISNNKDTLKSKIVSNGAVTVYYPSITDCYSSDYANYYSDNTCIGIGDSHLIVVVGWDDNYSKDNFTGKSSLQMTVHGCAKTVGASITAMMVIFGFLTIQPILLFSIYNARQQCL